MYNNYLHISIYLESTSLSLSFPPFSLSLYFLPLFFPPYFLSFNRGTYLKREAFDESFFSLSSFLCLFPVSLSHPPSFSLSLSVLPFPVSFSHPPSLLLIELVTNHHHQCTYTCTTSCLALNFNGKSCREHVNLVTRQRQMTRVDK